MHTTHTPFHFFLDSGGWLRLRLLRLVKELAVSLRRPVFSSQCSPRPHCWRLAPAWAAWAQWRGGVLIPSASLNTKILLIYPNIIENDRDNPWRIDLSYLSTLKFILLRLKIISPLPIRFIACRRKSWYNHQVMIGFNPDMSDTYPLPFNSTDAVSIQDITSLLENCNSLQLRLLIYSPFGFFKWED